MKNKYIVNTKYLSTHAWVLVLLLGLYFRTAYISHTPMGHYGCPYFTIALDIVEGKNYPLNGPKLGFLDAYHGPAAYYLISLPLFISRSPIGVFIYIAILNVMSVYVVYRTGKDFFSKNTGLIAAILHAINPSLLMYTKDVSDKGLTMIFISLAYYCFFAIMSKKKAHFWWFVFPVLFSLGIQIHIQLGLILLLFIITFYYYKPFVYKIHLTIGIIFGTLLLSPMIWHDIVNKKSLFIEIIHAIGVFSSGNTDMPKNLINRSDNLLYVCIRTFGVLFYFYIASVIYDVYIAFRRDPNKGMWTCKKDIKALILFLFSAIPIIVFSKHPNQSLLRHLASYTPIALFIGVAFDNMIAAPINLSGQHFKVLLRLCKVFVVLCFVGMLTLYTIKSYGYTLFYVKPGNREIFKRFIPYLCLDNDIEKCEANLEKAHELFAITTYSSLIKQYDIIYDDFEIDKQALIKNMHGMQYLYMFGDNGYLYRTVKSDRNKRESYHYLKDEREGIEPFIERIIYEKALFTDNSVIMKYKSKIDYSSIRYMYLYNGEKSLPNKESLIWYKFESGLRFDSKSIGVDKRIHWERSWEQSDKIVEGVISGNDEYMSILLVIEMIYPDQVETLTGLRRDISIKLYFNKQNIEAANKAYVGNELFGESYKYYYIIDSKLINNYNTFVFNISNPGIEKEYLIDVYGIPLKY